MDYVRRRGKIYHVVVPVPADLQALIGKRQIWRSLRTKCYTEAKSAARKLLLTVDVLFQRVRDSMDGKLIDSMVAQYGLSTITAQDKARLGVKVSDDPDYNDFMLNRAECLRLGDPETVGAAMAKVADMLQREEAKGRHLTFGPEAADIMLAHYNELGLVGGPDEVTADEVTEVVAAFATAERHLFKVESERMQGITEDDSAYQHRLLGRWRANLPVRKDLGLPLEELFRLYGEDWAKRGYAPARLKRKAAELKYLERVFAECFGSVPKVKEVTPETALELREYLQHEFTDDMELTNKTVNLRLEVISAVFNFGKGHKSKFVSENPFKGLNLPEGVKSDRSRIFEPSELQAYLVMLADLHNPDLPGMTWLPLIMMFSGMRCNEVAQLFVDDVQVKDGIDFFQITGNSERNQHVKSAESVRNVPIHAALIELGLKDYVSHMKGLGHTQLFPNFKYRPAYGLYYDNNLSTRFNEPVNLISDDPKLRLYSLRANFRCSVEEALLAPILAAHDRGEFAGGSYHPYFDLALNNVMGHKVKGNTGDTVYRKRQLSIMNGVLQMAAYRVDFSRLKAVLTGLPCTV